MEEAFTGSFKQCQSIITVYVRVHKEIHVTEGGGFYILVAGKRYTNI